MSRLKWNHPGVWKAGGCCTPSHAQGAGLLERGEIIEAAIFEAGPTFYRLDLPLGRLEAGVHVLHVEAERGGDRATRTMRFQVE